MMMINDPVKAECAKHLVLLARELRDLGDVPLVMLSDDGVTTQPVTLAGELELIAMRLDMSAAQEESR